MTGVFPLDHDGTAQDVRALLLDGVLTDLTPRGRFGLKGPGAADWFSAQGFTLPRINTNARQDGVRICRLGKNDVMVLDGKIDAADALRQTWQASPSGFSSWREEAWGWLRLSGPNAPQIAARLTAFDLRPSHFAQNAIAQTRFAHQDAVILRAGDAFDLFFDISATVQVVRDIHTALRRAPEVSL